MLNLRRPARSGVCVVLALLLAGCGGGGGGEKPGAAQPRPKKPVAATAKQPEKRPEVQPEKQPVEGNTSEGTFIKHPWIKSGQEDPDKKMIQVGEARASLSNTEWDIVITPRSGEDKKPIEDRLRFIGRQVFSLGFRAEGYPPTNYSLRVKPNGTIVWETMQKKEGGGMLFWRGTWTVEKMTGTLSKRGADGQNQEFSFVSEGGKRIEGKPKEAVR